MKRYLLFAGHDYYPWGGFGDLFATADTIEQLQHWFADNPKVVSRGDYLDNWAQIVDRETMAVVAYGAHEHGPPEWQTEPYCDLPSLVIL